MSGPISANGLSLSDEDPECIGVSQGVMFEDAEVDASLDAEFSLEGVLEGGVKGVDMD